MNYGSGASLVQWTLNRPATIRPARQSSAAPGEHHSSGTCSRRGDTPHQLGPPDHAPNLRKTDQGGARNRRRPGTRRHPISAGQHPGGAATTPRPRWGQREVAAERSVAPEERSSCRARSSHGTLKRRRSSSCLARQARARSDAFETRRSAMPAWQARDQTVGHPDRQGERRGRSRSPTRSGRPAHDFGAAGSTRTSGPLGVVGPAASRVERGAGLVAAAHERETRWRRQGTRAGTTGHERSHGSGKRGKRRRRSWPGRPRQQRQRRPNASAIRTWRPSPLGRTKLLGVPALQMSATRRRTRPRPIPGGDITSTALRRAGQALVSSAAVAGFSSVVAPRRPRTVEQEMRSAYQHHRDHGADRSRKRCVCPTTRDTTAPASCWVRRRRERVRPTRSGATSGAHGPSCSSIRGRRTCTASRRSDHEVGRVPRQHLDRCSIAYQADVRGRGLRTPGRRHHSAVH